MVIKRGDIFYADLRPVVGSEQGGIRPVLIIQNDIGNKHSPTVICAAITSKMNKAKLPTHIEIDASSYAIVKDSVILLEQLRTIDKRRLKDKVCHLDAESQSCPVREPGTSHYIVKISFSQAFASCMAMGNHQVFTGTKAVV